MLYISYMMKTNVRQTLYQQHWYTLDLIQRILLKITLLRWNFTLNASTFENTTKQVKNLVLVQVLIHYNKNPDYYIPSSPHIRQLFLQSLDIETKKRCFLYFAFSSQSFLSLDHFLQDFVLSSHISSEYTKQF